MPVDYRDSVACEYGCLSSLPAPDFLAFLFLKFWAHHSERNQSVTKAKFIERRSVWTFQFECNKLRDGLRNNTAEQCEECVSLKKTIIKC